MDGPSALGWSNSSCRKYGPCSKKKFVRVAKGGDAPSLRPKCLVTVGGIQYSALIDTGADVCLAGRDLFDWCTWHKIPMRKTAAPRMADGLPSKLETFEATLRIECQGRSERAKVILQPQRQETG